MIEPYYCADAVTLYLGDCIEVMRGLPEASVDAVVCDPPYGLEFMGKAWDRYEPREFQAWCEAWAREAYRVLKPGGHLAAFGGTRTHHRLVCGIEDAGFEIRDELDYMFGSGFPKSLDVSKAIDRMAGAEREVIGVGAAACEYIERGERCPGHGDAGQSQSGATVHSPLTAPATEDAQRWQGWGTALKPAHEPICLARKPLAGTVAANVLRHGTGALNIDGTRLGTEEIKSRKDGGFGSNFMDDEWQPEPLTPYTAHTGRWPANVLLDEEWSPVLCLRYNLSDDAWSLLEGWCRERSREVPTLRGRDRRLAEQSDEDAVLLARLLGEVDEREQPRGGASDDGAQALGGISREDARYTEEERQARGSEPPMEGRLVSEQGVQDALARIVDNRGASDSAADDSEGASVLTGAQARNGDAPRATVAFERGGASLQRGEDGQPDREPRTTRRRDSQAGAQADRQRVASTSGRERTTPRSAIEVLMRDVPREWLRYFQPTGDVARVGAAALLDATVGERKAGGKVNGTEPSRTGQNGIYNAYGRVENAPHNDRGGPSRFFYTAKASRSEREAGLEELPPALRTDGRPAEGPGADNPRLRVTERHNDHPTVKPIAVMRWLVRLVTPPGGTVLDPFLGSGTTALAALDEGIRFIGIDITERYVEIARYRLSHRHLLEVETRPASQGRPQGLLL